MVQNLEEPDIKKLKSYIWQGYWLGGATAIIFLFLSILSLKDKLPVDPFVTIFFGISLSGLIIWLLNASYISDLRSGKKEVVEKQVQVHDDERKIKKSKVGALFSSWSLSKKKNKNNFLIHIENATFEVTEEQAKEAEKRGRVILHYTLHSNIVLKVEI